MYSGIICGEVNLRFTLCMLAGDSYFDLGLIFGTGSTYPYAIFHRVILNGICDDRLVNVSGIEYCKDEDCMKALATDLTVQKGWPIEFQFFQQLEGILRT